jgi:hypothetical protein
MDQAAERADYPAAIVPDQGTFKPSRQFGYNADNQHYVK